MNDKTNPPPAPPAPKSPRDKMIRIDLANNTPSMQSIDAGDEAHTRIVIAPGEVKRNIEVASWVAQELRKRAKNKHRSHQLIAYDAGKAPAPAPQPSANDSDEDDGEDDGE